jgi:hypothetical protein
MRHSVGLEPRIAGKLLQAYGEDRRQPWKHFALARSIIATVRYWDAMRRPDVPPGSRRRRTPPDSPWRRESWKACPRCCQWFQRAPNAKYCFECSTYRLSRF